MPYDQAPYDPYGGYAQGGGYYAPQQQCWPQPGWDPYGQQSAYQQQGWQQQGYDPYGQWQGYYQQPGEAFYDDEEDTPEETDLPEEPPANTKGKKKGKELNPKLQKPLHALLQVLYWVTMIVIVFGAILFASSKDPRKNYFGFRTYNVLTQSMMVTTKEDGVTTPKGLGPNGGFDPGDTIVIKMDPPESIKVGDIITYNPSSRDKEGTSYLTHRVIEVKNELSGKEGLWFVTQGDHNPSEDPPISSDMYIGRKVFHIPKIGKLLGLVKAHPIMALMMFVSFFGCIFLLRWYFTKPQPKESPAPLPA